MTKTIDQYAPYQSKSISVVDEAPWFDSEYRDLCKLRRQAERVKHRSEDNLKIYRNLCTQASVLATVKKKLYFDKVIKKSDNKPHKLYQV